MLAAVARSVPTWGVEPQPKVTLPRNLATAVGKKEAHVAHRADVRIDAPGASMFVDVVGHHPSHRGATKPGVAALEAHRAKLVFYQQRYIISQGNLIPFAFETMGHVADGALALIKLAARTIVQDRAGYALKVRYLYLRIGMAILRGTVNTVAKSLALCVQQHHAPGGEAEA